MYRLHYLEIYSKDYANMIYEDDLNVVNKI